MSPTPDLPAPPAAAKRWLGALLALAVTVPLSLAPLLGNLDIPGFRALLSLYPTTLRDTALPLASLAMALVAISVQFFSRDAFSGRRLRRWFLSLVLGLFALLLVLAYVHNQSVVRVYIGDGTISESYVVGSRRIPDCHCDLTQGDSACIQHIGLDPAMLPSCWSEAEMRSRSFVLLLLYLLLMAGTGALVGLGVMLRVQRKKKPAAKGK